MTRRRMFTASAEPEGADVRPTLLGVVTLLFLLLFFLLGTTSGEKLATIGLHIGTADGLAPLPHAGLLKSLRVEVAADGGVTLRADVQTTDIAASSTTTEARVLTVPAVHGVDTRGVDKALADLHALDPTQRRATVLPADGVTTQALMTVLDAVRGPSDTRFPEVLLQDLDEMAPPPEPTAPATPLPSPFGAPSPASAAGPMTSGPMTPGSLAPR